MSIVLPLVAQILHLAVTIVAAPAVTGVVDWLDARLSGRAGPPLLLPWHDLIRLTRKTRTTGESVSIVHRLAPAVDLGATLSAAALVPSFALGMALAPLADVLVIVSLLTIARLAASLAALDAGSALPGLAAQNASAQAVLAEPALMLAVVTLGLMASSLNLDLIIVQQREGLLLPAGASAVALTAMLALVFADDSAGASELDSMFSGIDLATSRMAGWLRRVVWIDLIGGLFLPIGMATADDGPTGWLTGLLYWCVKLGAFVVILSAIQTSLGRVPRHSLHDLIGVAALLALLAMVMVLASTGMI